MWNVWLCISRWQPTEICNSLVPSLCSSALLGEQAVSAALGISSVAGSGCIGCICRSKFPGSPAVLIFKGKWGRRLQSYIDRSGYGNFTKKWLCNGWGLKEKGTHGITLPCALNCLFQKLSFLGSSCRACRLCTEPSKLPWAVKDKLCTFSLLWNINSEYYKLSSVPSLVACASWVSLAVHLGLVRNQIIPGAERPPVLTLPFHVQGGEHGALHPSVLLRMKISPAFCWRLGWSCRGYRNCEASGGSRKGKVCSAGWGDLLWITMHLQKIGVFQWGIVGVFCFKWKAVFSLYRFIHFGVQNPAFCSVLFFLNATGGLIFPWQLAKGHVYLTTPSSVKK